MLSQVSYVNDFMVTRIQVDNISKCYRIGKQSATRNSPRYRMLRDVLVEAVKAPFRNLRSGAALGRVEDFWALRDVSFEVHEGEALAIVGANGSGKSTLLKILTQITMPSRGKAHLRGRVGSLLEVGTGFHPELTGKENVFLNGSILGMKRSEIKKQFDKIVDFAGIQKFIDTPVKRYSSGMKVRLGFAVAAHLDLEILLIDEVLAVGDAEFQRKCLGRMDEIAQSGRTVLFVSHDMAAVENLCSRAILLDHGRVLLDATSREVVSTYLSKLGTTTGTRDLTDPAIQRFGTGKAKFEHVKLQRLSGEMVATFGMGEGLHIHAVICAEQEVLGAFVNFIILDSHGDLITVIHGSDQGNITFHLVPGQRQIIDCRLPRLNLHPGTYAVSVEMRSSYGLKAVDYIERAVNFEIFPADVFGTGKHPEKPQKIFLESEWSVTKIPS